MTSIVVSGDEDEGFQDEVFCGDEDVVDADDNDIIHGQCDVLIG